MDCITHCIKLGFPRNSIPEKKYLEKIKRSRIDQVFENFNKKTDVKDQIDRIRKNILIQENSNKDKRTNNACLISRQLLRYIKADTLKKKIQQAHKKNEINKCQEISHIEDIHINSCRKIRINKSSSAEESKLSILQAKNVNLDEQIASEQVVSEAVNAVYPPNFSTSVKIDKMNDGMQKCLKSLKRFYEMVNNNEGLSSELWNNMRTALKSIPNMFIFQAILRQMDLQISCLLQSKPLFLKEASLSVKELASKINQQLIVSGVKYFARKNQSGDIKSLCSERIQNLTHEIEGIISESSFQYEEDEDNVGDFVSVLLKFLVVQGKLEHGSAFVYQAKLKTENSSSRQRYGIVFQESLNIDNIIVTKSATLQQTIGQIWQVKEKLNLEKISMLHIVQDLKNRIKHQELNRTMMSSNTLPNHHSELKAFLATPIINFDSIPNEISFELNKIELMRNPDIASCFGGEKKGRFFLESFPKVFEVSRTMIIMNAEPKIDETFEFSFINLEQRHHNREAIYEILDEITKVNMKTKIILNQTSVLYNSALKNIFKRFVHSSKKFEGKTFREFENEFNLYYNMVKD